jgi:hypothetical protein
MRRLIRNKIQVVLLIIALLAPYGHKAHAATAAVQVNAGERLLVVAPHPDNETLGAGGLIQRVLSRGGSVLVVLVTAGDGYVEAVVHETGQLRPRPADYIAYGDQRPGKHIVRRTSSAAIRSRFMCWGSLTAVSTRCSSRIGRTHTP